MSIEKKKQISFTAVHTAEMIEKDLPAMTDNSVLVRTEYTVISGGTERACIMGFPNTSPKTFPKKLGYCGVARVLETGSAVKKVAVGDRVLVYHGYHSNYNVVAEDKVYRVDNDELSSLEASFAIIAAMGLGGVRKLEIEIAEPAMVMGLGLLGMFSVQFCRLNGAYPVIAADLNPERRRLALELGADYALDPRDPGFAAEVKRLTKGKGVSACVEVTGVAAALKQALECASFMGRIALLGCTRVSDCEIDYYRQIHKPGVTLVGAHNMVRPKVESFPHHWTNEDDCRAILDLISSGRLKVLPMVSRVCSPDDYKTIYDQLCDDPMFPMGTVFDWRDEKWN